MMEESEVIRKKFQNAKANTITTLVGVILLAIPLICFSIWFSYYQNNTRHTDGVVLYSNVTRDPDYGGFIVSIIYQYHIDDDTFNGYYVEKFVSYNDAFKLKISHSVGTNITVWYLQDQQFTNSISYSTLGYYERVLILLMITAIFFTLSSSYLIYSLYPFYHYRKLLNPPPYQIQIDEPYSIEMK